jgi:hypothetical protein
MRVSETFTQHVNRFVMTTPFDADKLRRQAHLILWASSQQVGLCDISKTLVRHCNDKRFLRLYLANFAKHDRQTGAASAMTEFFRLPKLHNYLPTVKCAGAIAKWLTMNASTQDRSL